MTQAKQVAAVIRITGKEFRQIAMNCTSVYFNAATACLPFEMQQPHQSALAGTALSHNSERLVAVKVKGDVVASDYGTTARAEIGILF
jgi:hypothetical protein